VKVMAMVMVMVVRESEAGVAYGQGKRGAASRGLGSPATEPARLGRFARKPWDG
jgi:hypothetical protein